MLYFLLSIIQLFIFNNIYWECQYSKKVFYIEILIFFFFSLLIFIFVIINIYLTLSIKLLGIYQILSKVFFFIFFVNCFIISFVLYNNSRILYSFYKLCPYSYDIRYLTKIFDNYKINDDNKIKTKCNYRRCIINNIYIKANYYVYNYICNFEENNNNIKCSHMNINNQINDILFNYVGYCKDYTRFYKCERRNNMIINKISYDIICPNKSDVSINIGMIFFLFLLNCLVSLPWLLEYYLYHELILISTLNNNNPNHINHSLRETNYTSNIDEKNNNSLTFKKEPTRLIIIDNNNYNNKSRISNVKINNYISNINITKKQEILCINKNNNSNKNVKNLLNEEKLSNNNNIDKSKTENQLISDNKINDIVKVINRSIKFYKIKKDIKK